MKPLVSILIPTYNAQEWVADTLRSVLDQSWDNKEIIVVDDGSKDDSVAVLRKFEAQGVRVFTQPNQGAAVARNKAFSLSSGDYIQWLDADDLLSPDKIARQVEVLEACQNKRILASAAWGHFLYRVHRAKFISNDLWQDLTPVEWLLRKMGQNLHMQTATWLVSRELTEATGPWDPQMWVDDDGEYFCRVLLQSDGVRFVPEAKVYYRVSGTGSLSFIGYSDRKLGAQLRSMELHINYLKSLEDSPRVRAVCVQFLQNWMLFFYPQRLDMVERMQAIAADLGGRLEPPRLSWKYSWLRPILGDSQARRARRFLQQLKMTFLRFWDKIFYRLSSRQSYKTKVVS